jgi:hypothetical protein
MLRAPQKSFGKSTFFTSFLSPCTGIDRGSVLRFVRACVLPCWLFILDVETVEISEELRGLHTNFLRRTAFGRLLEGCADLRNPIETVAGTGSRSWTPPQLPWGPVASFVTDIRFTNGGTKP